MPTALTYDEAKAAKPCSNSFRRVSKLLGGAKGWNGNRISAADARAAGCTFDDIVWIASAVAKTDADVERRLRLWMADCAARVLHSYEKTESSEAPRNAIIAARQFARGEIDAARQFARGEIDAAAMDAARVAASDAARAAAWDAAWPASAARAAARAAARDAMVAAWPASAARAAAMAAARDAMVAAWPASAARAAAMAAEEAWQFDRLIARLSDDEPDDVPLPERAQIAA